MIKAVNLTKTYRRGPVELRALDRVNFSMAPGEAVAIMGASGSGKTTLLQILGTLDRPDSGEVHFGQEDLSHLSDSELSRFRRRKMGFVFQYFNLLQQLTAVENVAWPLILDGRDPSTSHRRAADLLRQVGLEQRDHHFPFQLSGGEMQRVAIARALVSSPELILADEPTGNLDSKTGTEILDLLSRTRKENGASLLMVTHDRNAASICDRIITLRDGVIVSS